MYTKSKSRYASLGACRRAVFIFFLHMWALPLRRELQRIFAVKEGRTREEEKKLAGFFQIEMSHLSASTPYS